jgi:hypothetical protein
MGLAPIRFPTTLVLGRMGASLIPTDLIEVYSDSERRVISQTDDSMEKEG